MSFATHASIEGFGTERRAQLIRVGLGALDRYFHADFIKSVCDTYPLAFRESQSKPNQPVALTRLGNGLTVIEIHKRNEVLASAAMYGALAVLFSAFVDPLRVFNEEASFAVLDREMKRTPTISAVSFLGKFRSELVLRCSTPNMVQPWVAVHYHEEDGPSNTPISDRFPRGAGLPLNPIHYLHELPWKLRRELARKQLLSADLFVRVLTSRISALGHLDASYKSANMQGIGHEGEDAAAMGDHMPLRFSWPAEEIETLHRPLVRCLDSLSWRRSQS